MANTPGGRPFVTRLYPSAIPTPTRSCRQMIGLMPMSAADSITGVVGNALRYSMPSFFRMWAMASRVRMEGS